jgi:hypothetical protein
MDIRFYREESSKELGIKADCNYIVVSKDYKSPYKLMPYSIYYVDDTRSYVALKIIEENRLTIDPILDSSDIDHLGNQKEFEAFNTLKEAKEWIYYDIKGAK